MAIVLRGPLFAAADFGPCAQAQTDAAPASASVGAASAPHAPLAADVFFRALDITAARLLPSGRWLAMTTALGSVRSRLIVFDLQEWKLHAQLAHYSDVDVHEFAWVGDERLVFSLPDLQSSARSVWWPGLFSV